LNVSSLLCFFNEDITSDLNAKLSSILVAIGAIAKRIAFEAAARMSILVNRRNVLLYFTVDFPEGYVFGMCIIRFIRKDFGNCLGWFINAIDDIDCMKILDIPSSNRPRERLKALGAAALSDAELLAIVLQKGTSKENVVDLSNRLLSMDLWTCSLSELMSVPGIGEAKGMQIIALRERNPEWRFLEKSTLNIIIIATCYDIYTEAEIIRTSLMLFEGVAER
jgi:hypothetical protein